MKPILLVLLIALAAMPTHNRYQVLGGRLRFDAPSDWREAARTDTDSLSAIAFAVPRPHGDTTGPAVNVIVNVTLSHRHLEFEDLWGCEAQSVGSRAREYQGDRRSLVAGGPESHRSFTGRVARGSLFGLGQAGGARQHLPRPSNRRPCGVRCGFHLGGKVLSPARQFDCQLPRWF